VAATREHISNKSGETLQSFDSFLREEEALLRELRSKFAETNAVQRATGLTGMADRLYEEKYYATAWTLAKFASNISSNPAASRRGRSLVEHLEGKRLSTKYVVSDLLDHGGTSILVDMIALAPAVKLMGYASKLGWLSRQAPMAHGMVKMLAGGAAHWTSSKAIQGLIGYSGAVMPRDLSEFAGQFASSTLQAGLASFLAGRKFMWGKNVLTPPAKNPAFQLAIDEVKGTGLSMGYRALVYGEKAFDAAWRSAIHTLKVGTVVAPTNLLQVVLHHFHIKDMTPQGSPSWLFQDTRLAVAQIYGAHPLLEDHAQAVENSHVEQGPSDDLDLFITQLDPNVDETKGKRQMIRGELYLAQDRLGLNIRRWVLKKKSLWEESGKKAGDELDHANRTFERQGSALRFKADGTLCLTDSTNFSCAPSGG